MLFELVSRPSLGCVVIKELSEDIYRWALLRLKEWTVLSCLVRCVESGVEKYVRRGRLEINRDGKRGAELFEGGNCGFWNDGMDMNS